MNYIEEETFKELYEIFKNTPLNLIMGNNGCGKTNLLYQTFNEITNPINFNERFVDIQKEEIYQYHNRARINSNTHTIIAHILQKKFDSLSEREYCQCILMMNIAFDFWASLETKEIFLEKNTIMCEIRNFEEEEIISPLSKMGNAFIRIFSIVIDILTLNKNEFLLIDDSEHGLQTEVIDALYYMLFTNAEAKKIKIISVIHTQNTLRQIMALSKHFNFDDYFKVHQIYKKFKEPPKIFHHTAKTLNSTFYNQPIQPDGQSEKKPH